MAHGFDQQRETDHRLVDEVAECEKEKEPQLLVYDSEQVLERVQDGDLFEPVLTMKQKLPADMVGEVS